VFAGAFRREDAERVGGGDGLDPDAVLDLLVALTEHSMIQAEGDSPRRYRMLEALRDHGRARLDEAAAEAAHRRHATHFAAFARAVVDPVGRKGTEAVGDPLVPYHWDLDAAFRWAFDRGETDLALDLATALGAFHHLVGTVTIGRELVQRALDLPGGDPARRIGAMRWEMALLLCELRLPATAVAIERARDVIARDGGPRDADELRAFEAQLAFCLGDLDAAARARLATDAAGAADYAQDGGAPGVEVVSPAAALRRAGFLAELAWRRLAAEGGSDPATVDAIYLG
jgi:non-specific serine/threonine protein kinase